MQTLPEWNKLRELIRKVSYREGDFTLASGKKSTFYIDLKATTLHAQGALWIGRLGAAALANSGKRVQAVGGLTLGADPIATAISIATVEQGTLWPAFIVRKEPKSHGISRFIEGTENLPAGCSVAIVEDVVTTGGSSIKAIERVRDQGYHVSCVLTVVDREQGGTEAFAKMGVPLISLFTISQIKS